VPTWQFYLNGLRKSGEPFALHQHAFGGMGGRPGKDGLASVSFPYNVRDVSAEWSEAETPLLIEKRELITDSGGPGESRGGLGEELVIQALPSSDTDPSQLLDLSGSSGRMKQGASGLLGGGRGSVASIVVGDMTLSPTASPHASVRVGERITMRLPGGGGYGDPRKRSREAIARDVRDGYVSRQAAKRDYGYDG
jgi:N-methylhydantoinase B